MTRASTPPPAPHRVLIFAVVAMALLMSSLDGTIVATALRAIERGLGASLNWTSWVITAYSVGMVLVLPLAGKLGDRFGRRRYFLFSAMVFTSASLCCGLATNIYVLIGLRIIQAAGGAGFTPSATGIITDHFGSARDRAVGLFGSIFPIGSMIGPIFGGLFVTYWSWRGIFFVNAPIGILLVLLGLRYIPADRHDRDDSPLDIGGMALLGVGAVSLMLAISYLGETGGSVGSPLFLAPLVVGAAGVVAFARHIRRTPTPFISPRLIAGPGFGPVNVINVLYGGAVAGTMALVPLYAVDRYHVSTIVSGTLLTAQGVAVIVMSSLAVAALRRTGYRLPLLLGSIVIAAGIVGLAITPPAGIPAQVWLAASAALVGTGTGFSSPASRNAGLQLAPDQSPAVAGLRSTGRQVGQIAAVSIITAIIDQSATPGHLLPAVFLVVAGLLVVFLPIISRIPEHKGAW